MDDAFLNHSGRCSLVFLLDASMLIGYHFFLNHIGRCGLASLLDGSLVIGRFFLNRIG